MLLAKEGVCCNTVACILSRSPKHESNEIASAMPSRSGVWLDVAALCILLCAYYRTELVQFGFS